MKHNYCVLKSQKSSFVGGAEDTWEAENGTSILKDMGFLYPL